MSVIDGILYKPNGTKFEDAKCRESGACYRGAYVFATSNGICAVYDKSHFTDREAIADFCRRSARPGQARNSFDDGMLAVDYVLWEPGEVDRLIASVRLVLGDVPSGIIDNQVTFFEPIKMLDD